MAYSSSSNPPTVHLSPHPFPHSYPSLSLFNLLFDCWVGWCLSPPRSSILCWWCNLPYPWAGFLLLLVFLLLLSFDCPSSVVCNTSTSPASWIFIWWLLCALSPPLNFWDFEKNEHYHGKVVCRFQRYEHGNLEKNPHGSIIKGGLVKGTVEGFDSIL